jgi:hypothetical protein
MSAWILSWSTAPQDACLLWVKGGGAKDTGRSSVALSRPDDLLHCSEPRLSAITRTPRQHSQVSFRQLQHLTTRRSNGFDVCMFDVRTVTGVCVMRCVACAVEMQVVRAVPDQSMILSGKELRTLECPRCHGRRQQFVLTRNIEQLSSERMLLPSASTWRPLIKDTVRAAVRRAWMRAVGMRRSGVSRWRWWRLRS